MSPVYTQVLEASGSPIHPTERGWKCLNESGLAAFIDTEKNDLLGVPGEILILVMVAVAKRSRPLKLKGL